MRKTLAIATLGVLAAVATTAPLSCGKSKDAGIILNVSTAPEVDRSAITALQVTVDGVTRSYPVTVPIWSVGIETSDGDKSIAVLGMVSATAIAQWAGDVTAVAGQVVYQDVELQAITASPYDAGGGAPAADGPIATGGFFSADGPIGRGGAPGTGGATGLAGASGSGGRPGLGGAPATGGLGGDGGAARTGGSPGSGGIVVGVGGAPGTGGVSSRATGGSPGTGGLPGTGGTPGTGGLPGTGGAAGIGGTRVVATGGRPGTGGVPSTGGTADICGAAPPLTGGTAHSGNNQGTAAGLAWELWSTQGTGTMTTYSTPAFSASWNNSGDLLARLGLKLDRSKTFAEYGTITAEFAEHQTGTAGGYSFIGVYGWSVNPCVEFYIIDDSYGSMAPTPSGGSLKGTGDIDGGTYSFYSASVNATALCPGLSAYVQFSSVRTKSRHCGQISVSEHFKAWKDLSMVLGKLDQVVVLVETGGGTGSIDFTTANVTISP